MHVHAYPPVPISLRSAVFPLIFPAQALVLRVLGCSSYGAADVAVASLSLVPFLGEAFDSLKDAMLAAQAIASDTVWVRPIGRKAYNVHDDRKARSMQEELRTCYGALGYLWLLHIAILLPKKTTRLELCRGYFTLFFLKRNAGLGIKDGFWQKILQLCYKQSTPTRWWAMLLEDAPQGIIASVISVADGLKPFTLAVNLKQSTPTRWWAMLLEDAPQGIIASVISVADGLKPFTLAVNLVLPSVRLLLAWLFHDNVAWEVQDWLRDEALDDHAAGRLALCNEYLAALRRLEDVAQERGWGRTTVLNIREVLRTVMPARLEADDEDNTWLQNGPPGPCEALRLDLRYTELGRELLRNLPEARLWALQAPPGRRPREVVLNLWRCGLGDEGCRVLRRSLRQIGGRCEELRLGLADNAITAKGAELLAEGLGEMKVLTVLKLGLSRNPELGDAGCEALCRSLRQMPELRSLNLDWSDTGLGAEGCAALAAALRELRLQELARDFSDAVTAPTAADSGGSQLLTDLLGFRRCGSGAQEKGEELWR
eukprot:s525_g14.t1